MVVAFGDMRGVGDIEFGDEDTFQGPDDEMRYEKRKAVEDLENQRQKRTRAKAKICAGLVSLGDSLAKGLIDAAAFVQLPTRVLQDLPNFCRRQIMYWQHQVP
ncbi:hypothetical protein H257_13456 [Aphanomyces astaci]|uniref:Uncharacterized protein n=1 Tax=Aphanomyces astaci TaxID=112090 RepID=W4FX01_APHAT|nr:hypothetical protein H257_13456 [Aphanomyces astaci]ETV71329.1 hypothetical protein H257_13456 [Aphanomyces astaci]|eukprot:XP_009839269.1 hypothetical protein H257_13456 [Aphanomyces astaci]